MKFPTSYFRDRSVLALLSFNAAMFTLTIINVLFNVDTELDSISIISFRANRVVQESGPTSDLYQFAFFALLVTVIMVALSVRLHHRRRRLAASLLGLNIVTLVLCLVVFNALTRTL